MIPTALFWSGGKDAALALYRMQRDGTHAVLRLITTLSEAHNRVVMHGVRRAVMEAQAAALGLPWMPVMLPQAPDHSAYDAAISSVYAACKKEGITVIAFGDIFLQDLRAYREEGLARAGMQGLFPLWMNDTRKLVEEVERAGIRATVVCADAGKLDKSFLGRIMDRAFVASLPANVDPCGERGEFHTFVWDAPMFGAPVLISGGEVVHRSYSGASARSGEGFYFLDLLPG